MRSLVTSVLRIYLSSILNGTYSQAGYIYKTILSKAVVCDIAKTVVRDSCLFKKVSSSLSIPKLLKSWV